MSTVAPVVPGTLQHPPSQAPQQQQQQQQQPSSSMNIYQAPNSTNLSSDTKYSHTMAQNQAQAQQLFRQRQLLAYQQQRQAQLQLQLQKQTQYQASTKQQPQPKEQDDRDHEKENRQGQLEYESKQEESDTSVGVSPVNSNDILMAVDSTPALDSSSTPLLISTSRSSVQNKRYSTGLAVLRLLQFAEQLSPGDRALQREFWDSFVADFFIPTSKTKWGLWNCETEERKSYYMSHYSMASFFHTLYMCGVSSIQLTLEQTMEYILPGGQMNVECPRANFIYRYSNGSLVSSTGRLWIRFKLTRDRIWKIKHFEFACQGNEEFIARSHLVLKKDGLKLKKSGKNALPETPINMWGIPSKAYHILQMVDVAVQLDDMIFYSLVAGTSAKESLSALAFSMEKKMSDSTTMATTPNTQSDPSSSSPTETNLSPTTKGTTVASKRKVMNKRPVGLTRRKSLKNENKAIPKEEPTDDSQQQEDNSEQNQNLLVDGEMDNTTGPTSPVVKTQSGAHPLQQQQQQQQAFFQLQRNKLLQQQAYHQSQAMLQMQQTPSLGSSPVPTPLSHQEPPLDSQAMTYPPQSYPGSFGTRHSSSQLQKHHEQQHDIDEMEDFIHITEQSRKRRNSTTENKKLSAARKKGISSK